MTWRAREETENLFDYPQLRVLSTKHPREIPDGEKTGRGLVVDPWVGLVDGWS
jgi:hypothetical protein